MAGIIHSWLLQSNDNEKKMICGSKLDTNSAADQSAFKTLRNAQARLDNLNQITS